MQPLSEIKSLLAAHNLAPRKSLGQNFLIDHNLIRKLVDASGAKEGDLILEVGPGTGALTGELLDRGCTVIACELDRGLATLLRERFAAAIASGHLNLIEADCLGPGKRLAPEVARALVASAVNPDRQGGAVSGLAVDSTSPLRSGLTHSPSPPHPLRPFTLIANLPYNAATPLMLALLMDHPECRALFVTIQREVADRIVARPGTKDYGTLGIIAQAAATPTRIANLPSECFWPRPDVASTMLALTRRESPATTDLRALADFCQRIFGMRRKQLGTILKSSPGLSEGIARWPEGVSPTMRAEQLSIEQLVALCRAASGGYPDSGSPPNCVRPSRA